jgi:transglutaminase-like putative cysteine protease
VTALIPHASVDAYLAFSEWIDGAHPAVAAQAALLAGASASPTALVSNTFAFVRDRIAHSWDARRDPLTCRASDVLLHGTGFCYAKSHLLAALLRANGIPAALCYQRLAVGEHGAPYCLHGLNAVFLPEHGWYRIDARGNKPGIDAQFTPPLERLAFPIQDEHERDFGGLYAEPLPLIVAALTARANVADLAAHLPDAAELAPP